MQTPLSKGGFGLNMRRFFRGGVTDTNSLIEPRASQRGGVQKKKTEITGSWWVQYYLAYS